MKWQQKYLGAKDRIRFSKYLDEQLNKLHETAQFLYFPDEPYAGKIYSESGYKAFCNYQKRVGQGSVFNP